MNFWTVLLFWTVAILIGALIGEALKWLGVPLVVIVGGGVVYYISIVHKSLLSEIRAVNSGATPAVVRRRRAPSVTGL